jgi:hypothetical protein
MASTNKDNKHIKNVNRYIDSSINEIEEWDNPFHRTPLRRFCDEIMACVYILFYANPLLFFLIICWIVSFFV